jgi:hypothetical protein
MYDDNFISFDWVQSIFDTKPFQMPGLAVALSDNSYVLAVMSGAIAESLCVQQDCRDVEEAAFIRQKSWKWKGEGIHACMLYVRMYDDNRLKEVNEFVTPN